VIGLTSAHVADEDEEVAEGEEAPEEDDADIAVFGGSTELIFGEDELIRDEVRGEDLVGVSACVGVGRGRCAVGCAPWAVGGGLWAVGSGRGAERGADTRRRQLTRPPTHVHLFRTTRLRTR